MQELWQLYDEQGRAIPGKGATKQTTRQGLLHAASHVWIWRKRDEAIEILVQKRAASSGTWPELFDISAAGHIDLGEAPIAAAMRETSEELGINVTETDLHFIATYRTKIVYGDIIENELQWLYLYELAEVRELTLQDSEVGSTTWQSLDTFAAHCTDDTYVPHGKTYYQLVIDAIEQAAD
jgi:isopentenyl-diphosphate Delta-isomerase